jgi:hypothetical protein
MMRSGIYTDRSPVTAAIGALALAMAGCTPGTPGGPVPAQNQNVNAPGNVNAPANTNSAANANDNQNANTTPDSERVIWGPAFDTTGIGFLSAVWGSAPDDIFVVGGQPGQAEVYHFDGQAWQTMNVPPVDLLVWVFGFGPDDVFAVGRSGGVIHYDGQRWITLPASTNEDLWGVWGTSPSDLWIVGGDVEEGQDPGNPGPLILHYDGVQFTTVAAPATGRPATALFKVWGIGSKVFAVGEFGLILEFDGAVWVDVSPPVMTNNDPDDDFVSLWGTSESNIVTVGGRSRARIAVYDGTVWTAQRPPDVPGLNAVFMTQPDEAIVGGRNGFCGSFELAANAVTLERDGPQEIHAIWGDGAGKFYGAGGSTPPPPAGYTGLALVRTIGPADIPVEPPDPPPAFEATIEMGCGPDCIDGLASIGVMVNGATYVPFEDGDDMPLFHGPQGGIHIFVTIRGVGFAPNSLVDFTQSGVLVESERVIISQATTTATFSEIAPGLNQIQDRFVFVQALPAEVDDQLVRLTFRVTDRTNPTITASVTQSVTIRDTQP